MKKLPLKFLLTSVIFFSSVFFFFSYFSVPSYSIDVDQLEQTADQKSKELLDKQTLLQSIEARIKEISGSNYSLSQQVNLLNKELTELQAQVDAKNAEVEAKLKEIEEKEGVLAQKESSLDEISGELYIETRLNDFAFFGSVSSLDGLLQNLFFKKQAISVLIGEIEEINGEFVDLQATKDALEKEKSDLDAQKKEIDDSYQLVLAQKNKVQKELNSQYATKTNLVKSINGLQAELSDLQYQIIIARQGGTNVNLDSVPSGGDTLGSLAGFRASAPHGSFGVFAIGAYTHRNGMSQWGALERAEQGQNYSQILSAYYPGTTVRTGTVTINGVTENITGTISVDGYGVVSFEDYYLLGIYEVPESWPMEVLKAQAIAARTYALRYTSNARRSICTTESCQVFHTPLKTGAWAQAVSATRGMILTDGAGTPVSTQYAAVHGGWSNTSGWDTTDKTGNGDWMARAWESMSGVSWFYKSWYRSGYTIGSALDSSACYRYPWLNQTEMSDLVNVYQIWKAHNNNDPRITPVFDACHSSGNPYSYEEARALAAKPVTSVNLIVTSNAGGFTSTVTFYTNAGTISMTGNEFKTIYNVRAPGYLRIPQTGFVHINIEQK